MSRSLAPPTMEPRKLRVLSVPDFRAEEAYVAQVRKWGELSKIGAPTPIPEPSVDTRGSTLWILDFRLKVQKSGIEHWDLGS